MPYYCTVPRCTSMAGKAKNVSFHQFPRDEELAKLWNKILKRGKPYTKYSKVCSLHFKQEDYVMTSVGKHKGQWRTLRKDAVPSQNLPVDSPGSCQSNREAEPWTPSSSTTNQLDPRMHQQVAQAIYMQTMLAMQAARATSVTNMTSVYNGTNLLSSTQSTEKSNTTAPPTAVNLSELEQLLLGYRQTNSQSELDSHEYKDDEVDKNTHNNTKEIVEKAKTDLSEHFNKSYKCEECTRCFKDPDVFILHKRTHTSKNFKLGERLPTGNTSESNEKENFNVNNVNKPETSKEETLKANPILANLLRTGISNVPERNLPPESGLFDASVLSIENQIMTALAANMEAYIRNISTVLSNRADENVEEDPGQISDSNDLQDSENLDESRDLNGTNTISEKDSKELQYSEDTEESGGHVTSEERENSDESDLDELSKPDYLNCDKGDL